MNKIDKFIMWLFMLTSLYFLFIGNYILSGYYLILLVFQSVKIISDSLIKLVELKERENPVINIGEWINKNEN